MERILMLQTQKTKLILNNLGGLVLLGELWLFIF